MKKLIHDFERHWKAPLGWITANVLIVFLCAAKLGSHFVGELHPSAQIAVQTFLALVCVNLLFSLHRKASSQETEFKHPDFNAAKGDMEKTIHELSRTSRVIKVQIIGVAMYQSYEWIVDKLHHEVAHNPDLKLEFEICMSSRECLERWKLDTSVINWPELAERNLNGLVAHMNDKRWTCDGRIQIKAVHVYENWQQWHGILLNDDQLYLGRSTFELDGRGGKPRLTTGQNQYRVYQTRDYCCGAERINNFKIWFEILKRNATQCYMADVKPPQSPIVEGTGPLGLTLNPAT